MRTVRDAVVRASDLRRRVASDGTTVKDRRSLKATADLIFDILAASPRPSGAYAVLSGMRAHGNHAAPTIYRALAWLVQVGRIHRIETLKGYVARRGASREQLFDGLSAVFTICEHCLSVQEVDDLELRRRLHHDATTARFLPRAGTIEMLGTCEACRTAPYNNLANVSDKGILA